MVQAGEDPKFIARRMVIFASEDIGLAGNGALGLALNAFMAIERVGLPGRWNYPVPCNSRPVSRQKVPRIIRRMDGSQPPSRAISR